MRGYRICAEYPFLLELVPQNLNMKTYVLELCFYRS